MTSEAFEQALVQGRARFQRSEWQAAREAWDEGGRRTAGDERHLLEALALWAAAVEQHLHAHVEAAERLLLGAIERLNEVRGEPWVQGEGVHDALVASLESLRKPWTPQSHRWPEEPAEELSVELEHRDRCPFCGEPVLLVVAAEEVGSTRYVEDCPVCCRPLDVSVRDGRVTLGRGDGSG
jgi:hypothetical protein